MIGILINIKTGEFIIAGLVQGKTWTSQGTHLNEEGSLVLKECRMFYRKGCSLLRLVLTLKTVTKVNAIHQ
jgi:hypothetical protein